MATSGPMVRVTHGELEKERARAEIRAAGLEPFDFWDCRYGGGKGPDGSAPAAGARPRLLWACQLIGSGFAFGYATHANRMREALIAAGVSVVYDPSEDCDLAVHIMPTDMFNPVRGKRNLLFTTAEMSQPTTELSARPDVLVVPCSFNKEVFGKCYSGPIEVCQEGFTSQSFVFHQRKEPGPEEPFRVLFVGNSEDHTKGAWLLKDAWRRWRESGRIPPNCQLVVKTTGSKAIPLQYRLIENGKLIGPFAEPLPASRVGLFKAEILDNRKLPVDELVSLYHSAHVLVSPSLGEGYNLVLIEAFGTGAPCIWPAHTAMLDYADESIGYPSADFRRYVFNPREPDYFGLAMSEDALISKLEEAYHNFPVALARGRRASEYVHSQYTWAQAAEKFSEICRRYAR